MVTFGDWKFLNATLQDNGAGRISLILFSVWKNSIGQTVDIGTGGISMTGGEVATCYTPIFGVPPGSYEVVLFVVTLGNLPVSVTLTVPISISSSQ